MVNSVDDLELQLVLAKPPHFRFSGTIVRIVADYGFLQLDNMFMTVFLHKNVCEIISFASLRVGDRLRFSVRLSKTYPGKLVAGRITRETKT